MVEKELSLLYQLVPDAFLTKYAPRVMSVYFDSVYVLEDAHKLYERNGVALTSNICAAKRDVCMIDKALLNIGF